MDTQANDTTQKGILSYSQPAEGTLLLRFSGSWKLGKRLPSVGQVQKAVESKGWVRRISFDARELEDWDTGLLTFLTRMIEQCARGHIEVDKSGLPEGVQRLLALAAAVPERKGARREAVRVPFFESVGDKAVAFVNSGGEMLAFLGDASVAFTRLLVGKANFRRSDLRETIQRCGVDALPIVSLITLLVGLILAFVGAIQLRMFGAEIYVADLVGIGMVRVLGAVMAGIIMAGRTGAAFAAEIGTMQVNEEIDALQTLGVPPMEFLVLPRMLALTLMMPLLCLYADLMGVLGGMIVGVGLLGINFTEYFHETRAAVGLANVWIGLFHSFVFGVLIALSGCLRGMQCGRSASAVGQVTTSAVVTGIVAIIVATAIITVVCDVLGI
jgi:phospholipid/cholesterol/gamma-HCH transport system permease protein